MLAMQKLPFKHVKLIIELKQLFVEVKPVFKQKVVVCPVLEL
jgi:hypothetical protein